MPTFKNLLNRFLVNYNMASSSNIVIRRFCYTSTGTFGILRYKNFKAFTVEQPWNNNIPYKSCIPEGVYDSVWHSSPKFGRTLALTGNTVSIYPSQSTVRSHILFHVGNWPSDFFGCIGLGKSLACISGKLAVSHSKSTVSDFLEVCEGQDTIPTYIIRDLDGKLS